MRRNFQSVLRMYKLQFFYINTHKTEKACAELQKPLNLFGFLS